MDRYFVQELNGHTRLVEVSANYFEEVHKDGKGLVTVAAGGETHRIVGGSMLPKALGFATSDRGLRIVGANGEVLRWYPRADWYEGDEYRFPDQIF